VPRSLNRLGRQWPVLALWLLLLALPARAQQEVEIIQLRSQSVERVLPVLMPLLEPGGTLTGMNDQLFLRASRRNREDIKRALAAIDVPARRLIIHVSQNRDSATDSRGAAVGGRVVIGDESRARVDARVWDNQGMRSERSGQMVQTVEGGQAFIQVGRSLPLPMRQVAVGPGGAIVADAIVYRDIGSGFYARPRLNGERVSIEISQQAESVAGYRGGAIESQRLSTSVSGRLGEWIEIGGSQGISAGSQAGFPGRGGGSASESNAIWLMVEEAK
jgi:type II secretory pathway component GspD/PulD (secretin)